MANLLVHIHSGPELKNKLTLGLLVAKTGVAEGHSVKLFLAADAVHALDCRAEGEIVGQGTGDAHSALTGSCRGKCSNHGLGNVCEGARL